MQVFLHISRSFLYSLVGEVRAAMRYLRGMRNAHSLVGCWCGVVDCRLGWQFYPATPHILIPAFSPGSPMHMPRRFLILVS